MNDTTVYVLLTEIRDLMRQSVELQKQTLTEVRRQVQLEQSVVDSELLATHISSDLFSELLGQVALKTIQDNDNSEEGDN